MDVYRVNLFKKKLREILGAPWLRFYFSKDRWHICLKEFHLGEENFHLASQILKKNRIEHKLYYWEAALFLGPRGISIPIDQDAFAGNTG